MKLLYISCHETLEYYDLKILAELGFDVFSVGFYMEPAKPVLPTRPALNTPVSEAHIKYFKENICSNYKPQANEYLPFTLEFLNEFDVVVLTHFPHNVLQYTKALRGKLVIRSAGISFDGLERAWASAKADGAAIIRISPAERATPNYAGEDGVIRQSVDPAEFKPWIGDNLSVITINKWMKKRAAFCEYDFYEQVVRPFHHRLLGIGNDDIADAISDCSVNDVTNYLQHSRVYFSTCTKPAPLTYSFVEALMAGTPMVTIGPGHGNAHGQPQFGQQFEAHDFIVNAYNGFWGDNLISLRSAITSILHQDDLAAKLSKNGRQTAIDHFHIDIAKEGWIKFFETVI